MLDQIRKVFASVTDRLGMPIDKGIFEPVVLINAFGIHTGASCQGHLNRGNPSPWIEIEARESQELEYQIRQMLADGKRESSHCKQLQRRLKLLNAEEGKKIIPLLNDFYQKRPFDFDRHLHLSMMGHGQMHLMSHGSDFQELRSKTERAEKLKIYQEEFNAFAEFLKEKYQRRELIKS